jgi:hypothetical protein
VGAAFPSAGAFRDVLVVGAFICYAYGGDARMGDGRRFTVRFSDALDPSRPHHIELRRSADGAALGNSVFLAARPAQGAAA